MRHEHLGRISYDEALQRQLAARDDVLAGGGEVLFTLEHDPPVLTAGRRAAAGNLLRSEAELAAAGVQVRRAPRGGDWTYHGPGQLVVYAVVDLGRRRSGVVEHVAWLQDGLAALAREVLGEVCPSQLGAREGFPGLWVRGDRWVKIGAVGVHVHHGVTIGGASLNVDPDPWGFDWIVPCGLADPVSSLAALGATEGPDAAALGRRLHKLLLR